MTPNILFFTNHHGVLYIRKWQAGEVGNVSDKPATEQDKLTYFRWYNQFQRGQEQVPEGIPIENLLPGNPGIAAKLRGCGVFTLEQCSQLSGHALDSIGMGSQSWKTASEKLLAELNRGVPLYKYNDDIADLQERIAWLEKQVDILNGVKRGKRGKA